MNNLVEFHIGIRGCGKSEFIEKEMESLFSCNLYVGTLFPVENFPQIIQRHRVRRNESWMLYETNGDIEQDFICLDELLFRNKHIEACLIDGFSTWVRILSKDVYSMEWTVEVLVNNLILLIKKYQIFFRFIDVVPEVFQDRISVRMCFSIHNYLLKKALEVGINIKVIDWRYENL